VCVCVCVCVKNVYLFYKFPIYVEQCSLYIRYIAIDQRCRKKKRKTSKLSEKWWGCWEMKKKREKN